jgi:GrpB-like predicted nucleotidyltransferase (UPF0157 family)
MGEMRNIVVVPYEAAWAERYREEEALIRGVFGEELLAIHHIGSTAIAGMSAKPIIDIMPVVRKIERVDAFDAVMLEIGYRARGELGIAGRRHFVKGGDASRTHHVHAYEPENPEVTRHLHFRDYLSAHEDEAREYARLKIELAGRYRDDIDGYMKGKDGFIQGILEKAREWRLKKHQ